ncbi:MAG: hypothetical protein FDZ70_04695 [Actinobacteria bacterium]|nr:MAG: hypothetical protein FDZ70_04695 [Actinomycetota bacterium]
MPKTKKTTRELEAAFREAGFEDVAADLDCVRVWLARDVELAVRPVSAGHGRPQELRSALAQQWQASAPCVAATFVADHFTTGALEILHERGANYLDDRRFVFRNNEPFVAIRQDRRIATQKDRNPNIGLGGMTGVAAQQLLLDARDWWRVTELAADAGVAAGTAQACFKRLEQLDMVEAVGSGPRKRRRVVNKRRLLEYWAQAARAERTRALGVFLAAQGPVELARRLSGRLREAGIDHAVTGACGALLVAPHVTDVRRCEVWVNAAASDAAILDAVGADPIEKGANVTFLRGRNDAALFGHRMIEDVEVANPLRLYADLLEDPRRGEEQAGFLLDTVLGL